jgi:CMP-N-acetylneuraminic acid synthetase
MLNYVALIPARSGSKGIPKKNIKIIAGKPLVHWVIDAAINCKYIDEVHVAIDSSEFENIVNQIHNKKLKIYHRSSESATDIASLEILISEFINTVDCNNLIIIQPTSPQLTSDDLDKAIEKFEEEKSDSMTSVCTNYHKRLLWAKFTSGGLYPYNFTKAKWPNKQDFKKLLVGNGAFFLTSKRAYLESNSRLSGKIIGYEMDDDSIYEIDDELDWFIVEQILLRRRKNKVYKIKIE